MKFLLPLTGLVTAVSATTLRTIPDDPYAGRMRAKTSKSDSPDKNGKKEKKAATYMPGDFSWGYYIRE